MLREADVAVWQRAAPLPLPQQTPMKIVLFLPDLGGGGAQRTIINLVNTFSAGEHDTLLCVASGEGPARAWIANTVRLRNLHCKHVRGSLFPLTALIRKECPDVVLASMIDANIVAWAASRLAGRKRPHLIVRETNSQRARDDIGPLRRLLIRIAYRGADRVIALSEGVRHELIDDLGLSERAAVTIHNPIDYDTMLAEVLEARRIAPPREKSRRWIIGVGRLVRQKGFDRLIRAAAQSRFRDFDLVLIGEGPDRAMLQALADQLGIGGRLIMPGFVARPLAWLAHADLFVLPSRWEGFGHVIAEAMTAGLPVIAFDCPHGPRDIIEDGVTGILVPNDDEKALTIAIDRILSDKTLSDRLADAGCKSAARFANERIAAQYVELFENLKANGPAR
jgi:glycosyltransferase involved in cell wall biosynthesis